MKALALFMATTVAAFAGTVRDDANLIGPEIGKVRDVVATKPVWVETMVQRPPDIKVYADNRIAGLTTNGFIIVVTTQPRAWRISMVPIGLAAAPKVEAVGQRMAAEFKKGDIATGIMTASNELMGLTKAGESSNFWEYFLYTTLAILVFSVVAAVISLILTTRRSRAKEVAELEALRNERERKERRQAEVSRREERERRERPVPRRPVEPVNPTNPYFRMNRDDRERVVTRYVDHPQYSPGLLDDPIRFMLFMQMVEMSNQATVQDPTRIMAARQPPPMPPPRRDPDPPLERLSQRSDPEPERSDSSGSSGSWGSSSSSSSSSPSYDSGSSSSDAGSSGGDSSGGGGSW